MKMSCFCFRIELNNNKAMRVVHRERKEKKITCLKKHTQ